MLKRMFNHANILERSLDATWLKMEVASQNIANADTPGYDAKHVEFDAQFAKALDNSSSFKHAVTNSKHIQTYPADPLSVNPSVVSDKHYVARMDDNNVDIDREMVDMAKNTIQYNALVQKVNKEFARLNLAIRGGA